MVNVSMRLVDFYHHESCGKCAPCREGMRRFGSDRHAPAFEAGGVQPRKGGLNRPRRHHHDLAMEQQSSRHPLGDSATWFVMSAYKDLLR